MGYLTVPEIAAELRVDETTVRRHIRAGALVAVKAFGVIRVARTELDAYVDRARVQPDPPAAVPASTRRTPRPRTAPAHAEWSAREQLKLDRASGRLRA
jgi:excisionase family DNA binding protein